MGCPLSLFFPSQVWRLELTRDPRLHPLSRSVCTAASPALSMHARGTPLRRSVAGARVNKRDFRKFKVTCSLPPSGIWHSPSACPSGRNRGFPGPSADWFRRNRGTQPILELPPPSRLLPAAPFCWHRLSGASVSRNYLIYLCPSSCIGKGQDVILCQMSKFKYINIYIIFLSSYTF